MNSTIFPTDERELIRLEEDSAQEVRHHFVICGPCQNLFPSPRSVQGRWVETICDQLVRYTYKAPICSHCLVAKHARDFKRVCGLCGDKVDLE